MTRRVRISAAVLAAFHAVLLGAPLFAPYDYDEQHRDFPYAPPTRIHFQGVRPVVYSIEQQLPSGDYREDPSHAYPIRLFRGGRLFSVPSPGVIFLFGSDGFGRDVFSRVLYGGRLSLLCGILATILALGIGTVAGTAAGFYGGWTDRLIMRGGEMLLALPWLYLLLAVRAVLPLQISTIQAFMLVVSIVGTMGWVRPARLVRGIVFSTRERGYVLAARGFGAPGMYLIRRHILPTTWGVILTQATILIPQFILAEVTLSFLGLGVGEPVPSWGNMLAEARQFYALVSHPWLLAPGAVLAPLLLGYFVLADGLLMSVPTD